MIPCIKDLQLNAHKCVNIPSPKDLFARYGERVTTSPASGVQARFNDSKLSGYEEAQKVVDNYLLEERDAYDAQQAELDRLRLESEELKTLKDSNV